MGKRGSGGGGGIPGGRCSGISPGRAPSSPVDGVCSPTTGAGGGGATPWVPARNTCDSQSRAGGNTERFREPHLQLSQEKGTPAPGAELPALGALPG